jgi:hypothetical protein
MDAFDDPYWSLSQIYTWALTLDFNLVARAAPSELENPRNVVKLGHELSMEYYLRVTGPRLAKAAKRLEYVATHGKAPDVTSEDGRPEWPNNVLPLFRSGILKAWANLPGDPRAYEISKADWAGLEIVPSGSSLIVWRIGHRRPGAMGDFENVRVERESVLTVFPANSVLETPDVSDRSSPGSTDSASSARPLKPEAAAQALIRLFPDGRPSLSRNELRRELQNRASGIGGVSDSTIKRAIALAWPAAGSTRVK